LFNQNADVLEEKRIVEVPEIIVESPGAPDAPSPGAEILSQIAIKSEDLDA
jgi:hypothetical protein